MLISLADLKTKLGITVNTYDAFLTDRINFYSEVIETYCRTSFTPKNIRETFYSSDWNMARTNAVKTFFYPIQSINNAIYDTVNPILNSDLKVHKPTGTIFFKNTPFCWEDALIIEYTAGYATVPLPIQEVVVNLVGEAYNRKTAGIDYSYGSNVQSVSVPGTISIAFDYTLTNNDRTSTFGTILGDYANVLDTYRSERAVIGTGELEFIEVLP